MHPDDDTNGGSASLTKVGTITQCANTPASVSYNVKGSEVSWSVTSPTPLAGGWIVKFVGSDSTAGSFNVDPVASSVTTTCGGTVLTEAGDFEKDEATSPS